MLMNRGNSIFHHRTGIHGDVGFVNQSGPVPKGCVDGNMDGIASVCVWVTGDGVLGLALDRAASHHSCPTQSSPQSRKPVISCL